MTVPICQCARAGRPAGRRGLLDWLETLAGRVLRAIQGRVAPSINPALDVLRHKKSGKFVLVRFAIDRDIGAPVGVGELIRVDTRSGEYLERVKE